MTFFQAEGFLIWVKFTDRFLNLFPHCCTAVTAMARFSTIFSIPFPQLLLPPSRAPVPGGAGRVLSPKGNPAGGAGTHGAQGHAHEVGQKLRPNRAIKLTVV